MSPIPVLDADTALSMAHQLNEDISGRIIAVLVASQFDGDAFKAVCIALENAGASVRIIASLSGEVVSKQGELFLVDNGFLTMGSVQFDVVFYLALVKV